MLESSMNQINILQNALDASWLRNQVIAHNIANADTPDFKASDVSFQAAMEQVTAADNQYSRSAGDPVSNKNNITRIVSTGADDSQEDSRELSGISVVQDEDSSIRMDGNNVDSDAEMAKLASNTILYNSLIYAVRQETNLLKIAITEGK
ncbi:MAG: flagellar basal body rod protein FlgB [Clostridiaceae bacterium]|nr:flagellar basal body rod protein FlgB [Clostridiaceae bacterium]